MTANYGSYPFARRYKHSRNDKSDFPREEERENQSQETAQNVHQEDGNDNGTHHNPSTGGSVKNAYMLFVIARMQLIKKVLSPNSAANTDTVLRMTR